MQDQPSKELEEKEEEVIAAAVAQTVRTKLTTLGIDKRRVK